MIGGTAVQTVILAYITMKCDWDEEVGLYVLCFHDFFPLVLEVHFYHL